MNKIKMITNLLTVAKLSGVSATGILLGAVAEQNTYIIEGTHIPLGPAIACAVTLVGVAWVAGSWKQSLLDDLKELKAGQRKQGEDLEKLAKKIDDLPCCIHGNGCDDGDKKKGHK